MVHHETERAKSIYGLRCIYGLVRIVQPIDLLYDGLEEQTGEEKGDS